MVRSCGVGGKIESDGKANGVGSVGVDLGFGWSAR